MNNREVGAILDKIADLLSIKGENHHKIRAYRKAADTIYHLEEDINCLHQAGRIQELPGIGRTLKGNIEEIIEKGSCEYCEELLREIPQGVLDMLSLPGIGPKTVKIIYDHLGIDNLSDLYAAAEQKKIRKLPGLGGKTEYNIKKGIEMLNQSAGKITLGLALPVAQELRDFILQSKAVIDACIVGSIRRGKPLISDIDILVACVDRGQVFSKLQNYKNLQTITDYSNEIITGRVSYGIPFEIIMVSPEDYYLSMVRTTGSKQHLKAISNGIASEALAELNSEQEFYRKIDCQYIWPELRENRGEIDLAKKYQLPELITGDDIKGDLHVHSDWSDGANKIQELAMAAKARNYSYLAITDHSKSLPISGGLNEDRLNAQMKVIDALNDELEDITILKGIEVDVLKNGQLDFSDQVLEKLDIVVASIHSHFHLDKEKQTERVLSAIKTGQVDIFGHLTGRLLNRRSGYELDVEKILTAAAQHNVVLEINSHPDRLDIDEHIAHLDRSHYFFFP
jgi:DNA polymerase (family 10)